MLTKTVFEQHHFTSWQTTGKDDKWSSAYRDLWQVSPDAPTPAASPATHRPNSRTDDVNLQPRLLTVYRSRRNGRPGWPEHMRVNILPKDAPRWCKVPSLGDETSMPNPESDVLTTRPRASIKNESGIFIITAFPQVSEQKSWVMTGPSARLIHEEHN
jgi:hypothetical protein